MILSPDCGKLSMIWGKLILSLRGDLKLNLYNY